MNRMETLILLARGPDTWNDWADRMLSERQVLQDAGAWTECPEHRRNKATSQWHEMARADFSEHDFEAEDSFENFRFPGVALFEDATFRATPSFRRSDILRRREIYRGYTVPGHQLSGRRIQGRRAFLRREVPRTHFFFLLPVPWRDAIQPRPVRGLKPISNRACFTGMFRSIARNSLLERPSTARGSPTTPVFRTLRSPITCYSMKLSFSAMHRSIELFWTHPCISFEHGSREEPHSQL